jgi:signal transduction histidine kinase
MAASFKQQVVPDIATETRWDVQATTKSDGMGIGLSVSRAIIESHHGSLWAVCDPGPGATFSFSIPGDPSG